MMGQTDQEKRRARLDELRRVREELVRAGGFKLETPDEPENADDGLWAEQRAGDGSGAAAGALRERLGAARRGAEGGGLRAAGGRGQGGDRPLVRMLLERRRAGGGGSPGAGSQGDGDPDARRERLKRLIGMLERGGGRAR